MRAVVQRVSKASVTVDNQEVASIGKGFLVLLGIKKDDTEKESDYLIQKLLHLRIFDDEQGIMNKNIQEIQGDVLLVSQFTLYAQTEKGNRPSYVQAMPADNAHILFVSFIEKFRQFYSKVQTGVFRADMHVSLCNDGPITIIMESKAK